MKNKTAIFLTAFNEGKNLIALLETIYKDYEFYVIDDGSEDNTRQIVFNYGGNVISHCANLSQGFAYITGLKVLTEEKVDYAIHMDADGQHSPDEIPLFIEKFVKTDADIVQGSRILGKDYKEASFFRRTFLPYITWIINKITGYNMTDAMCGFRGVRVSSLKKITKLLDNIHESTYLAAEMWIRMAKGGIKVVEVPITMSKRSSGVSYKGLFRYGWGVSRAILKTLLNK